MTLLDVPLVILIIDDEGDGVQRVGGADGSLALLGLGHLIGVAVVGGDEHGVAVLLSLIHISPTRLR